MKATVKCAHTRVVPIDSLKPHPDNENKHNEKQITALAKIIAKLGQRSPIVVSNRSGYITKGHGRLEAVKQIGWTEVAIDEQDYESDLEELNDRVADNEIARYAEFQLDKFEVNLKSIDIDIKTLDLEEFGLLDFPINKHDLDDKLDKDKPQEFKVEVICVNGEEMKALVDELTDRGMIAKAVFNV